MPREQLTRELEKELMGRETEPHEIIYFKISESEILVQSISRMVKFFPNGKKHTFFEQSRAGIA
jgi:hypothetical protein